MSKLVHDTPGERKYQTGVEKVAVFPFTAAGAYGAGYAWNGITGITDSPSGGEPTDQYADNIKYFTMYSAETLGGTIEAFYAPDQFAECDGCKEVAPGATVKGQTRKAFGLVSQTIIGNDTLGNDYGKKMHFYYGCRVSPSEIAYSTVNESPDAPTLSWTFTTNPVAVTEIEDIKATPKFEIDSTKMSAAAWKAVEDKVYGTENTEPTFLLPDEIIRLINSIDGTTPSSGSNEQTEPQG